MRSLMDIGLHSLMSYQYAMTVTSQNMSNSEVPFYSRREVTFSEAFSTLFGNGVNMADVRRIYDESVNRGLLISNSALAKANTFLQNISDFEPMLDESSTSIANYINEAVAALNVINTKSGSAESRDAFLYQLQNITARFNALDQNLHTQQSNINKSVQADVNAINDVTARIADINRVMQSASDTEKGDLMDQRDQLLGQLADYLGVESSTDSQGITSLRLNNGTPLLVGTQVFTLATSQQAEDPSKLDIVVLDGQRKINVTSYMNSGELGGLLAWQNTGLDEAKNALGRLALVMSQRLNDQNRIGIDLNGQLGGDIFTDINTPLAMKQRVIANLNNLGNADLSVSIKDASQLTGSDYLLEVDAPGHYQITRKSDHQLVSSGLLPANGSNIDVDGFSLNINSASFASGDKYLLSPTKNAAGNMAMAISHGSKLALGLPVVTDASVSNMGTGQISMIGITDINNPSFMTSGYLNPPIRVEFTSASTYRLVNANDNSLIEDAIVYDPLTGGDIFPTAGGFDPGYRIHLSGDMRDGDQFDIKYNSNGIGDNRNGLLMAGLFQQGQLENNTLTFTEAYHSLSSSISMKTRSAQTIAASNLTLKNQAEARWNNLSQVSMPEEQMNLLRFTQAFDASAQIIDAGQKVFDTVLGLARR